MLDYNMLFRWFLDMSLEERGLDQSDFSPSATGSLKTIARRFFDAMYARRVSRVALR